MKALSGLDATFLSLETANSPMHNGMLTIFDGAFTFQALHELLAVRAPHIRTLVERLVGTPLDLNKPHWIVDPEFDVDNHLRRVRLSAPGGWTQLQALASDVFAQPLARDRPLWEIIYVEGVDALPFAPKDSVALLSKVHHAAVDGISGADIINLLYDPTPKARAFNPPAPEPASEPPGRIRLVARSGLNLVKTPIHITKAVKASTVTAVRGAIVAGVLHGKSPTTFLMAPRTPLNRPITADRRWDTLVLSLNRLKALKNAADAKLNDVVLAIVAGALRRYLLAHDGLPDEPLIAMAPVSVRPPERREQMGNEVSMMFVRLATDVADPVARIAKIQSDIATEKAYQGALDAHTLMNFTELPPFALAGPAIRLYTRIHAANAINPVWNCTITNVPGPQTPLYLAGRRLVALMGLAPVFDGTGLTMTVFSYDGTVTFSPLAAGNVLPDIGFFMACMGEAALELEGALLDDGDDGAIVLFSSQADTPTAHRCWHTDPTGCRCRNRVRNGAAKCYRHRVAMN